MRSKVFIGSSKEGLPIARAIQRHLAEEVDVDVWRDVPPAPGETILESLVNALHTYDFAVVALTPDDSVESRGEQRASPRDNVVFELGLFAGFLGRNRTFCICDNRAQLKLPTDLAGMTYVLVHDRPDNLLAAVGPACTSIIDAITKLGPFRKCASRRFEMEELVEGHWIKVGDHGYSFIVRFHSDGTLTESSLSNLAYRYAGRWTLEQGDLIIEIDSDSHYRLRVIASRDQPVHSGIEENSAGGRNDFRLVHVDWKALQPY